MEKDAPVYLSQDGRSVILVGYRGETTLLDTTKLGPTYGVFTLTVEYPGHEAANIRSRICLAAYSGTDIIYTDGS